MLHYVAHNDSGPRKLACFWTVLPHHIRALCCQVHRAAVLT